LEKSVGLSSLVLGQNEEALDYRPLPPANRAERPRGFDAEPVRAAAPTRVPGRAATRAPAQRWTVPVALAGVLVLILAASLALTGGGGPPAAPATPTPSQFDTFESSIPQARAAAEQNPKSAQAWIDLGNVLYDSAQIVRESAPDSPL